MPLGRSTALLFELTVSFSRRPRKCQLQSVNPYTYLVDTLQRIDRHPAKRVIELTPRMWKTLFADNPLRPDLDRARDPLLQ